ncbi:MAG: methenyltetrahydromethanopterin cyclohydrolase [Thermoprotei archaeon]|nr:MAG: methenyltetrahydromethanopterin cyclohydrolase [Thermoprotei archaeon]
MGISMNKLALRILDRVLSNTDLYKVKVHRYPCGATVVDAGVETMGSMDMGIELSKISLGGLARVDLTVRRYDELALPCVIVYTDYPIEACLLSQLAGWRIADENFYALGSGPARALARKPKKWYEEFQYHETSDEAVLVLETDRLPPDRVLVKVAEACGISPKNLYVVVTSFNSVTGTIQVSARVVETGLYRLRYLGFDLRKVITASGACPVAPPCPNYNLMFAKTNDMIAYGGETYYVVDCDDSEIAAIIEKAPFTNSKYSGRLMYDIFSEVNFDLYKLDPSVFAVALVQITNRRTSKVFYSGRVDVYMLKRSLSFTPEK